MPSWLLLACSPDATVPSHGDDVYMPTTTPEAPFSKPKDARCESTEPDPGAATVDVSPHGSLANLQYAHVELAGPASVAVSCTLDGDPDQRLLWESHAVATSHDISLSGLLASQSYRCVVAPTCPRSAEPATPFDVVTQSLPASIPAVEIQTHPTLSPWADAPHLLVNHTRHCEGDPTHRLLVYDLDGQLRWYYDALPRGTPIAIGAQYVGNGRFVWGGGWTPQGAPEILSVDHQILYKTTFPGSADLVFHHEGRMLADGSLLMITQSPNTVGAGSWEGFRVWVVDPVAKEVRWWWDSQRAVDDGVLPTGSGDVYHANAADVVDTPDGPLLVVSLCFIRHVLGIDVATGEVRWDFGPGGDFTLTDPAGTPLANREYPDCQHGIEFDGERLLAYDNGRYFRGYSRAAEFQLDLATWTATQTWTWTEPRWWEGALGDVDVLSPGRVLVTEAHPECWSGIPDDRSDAVEVDRATGEVVWRHRFLDVQDTSYRSERFDGCDVFPQVRFCPAVAAREAELADALSEVRSDEGTPR